MFGRILLHFFLHLTIYSLPAQCNLMVTGSARDAHDNSTLPYSLLIFNSDNKSYKVITDEAGNFQIDSMCAGTFQVAINYADYHETLGNLEIKRDTLISFKVEIHPQELEEVEITMEKHESAFSHHDVEHADLDDNLGKPLAETVKEIPGVTTLNTGSGISKPVVHGMHSNRLLIMNNGVRHEAQQWGNEHAPEIDPFLADQITVIKGASGVLYGSDAIAGVIAIKPPPLRDSIGLNGKLQLAGYSNGRSGSASALLDGKHKIGIPISWRVQGTLKKSGHVKTPDYYLDNTGVQEYNFSTTLGYRSKNVAIEAFYSQFNTQIGIYSGVHIGNLTDLNKALNGERIDSNAVFSYDFNRPYQHVEHELTKLSVQWFPDNYNKLSFTYARQFNKRQEYDKDRPLNDSIAALNLPEFELNITTHTADLKWDRFKQKHLKSTYGLSSIYQANTYDGRFFIPNFRNLGLGGYFFEEYDSGAWQVEAGLRLDTRQTTVYYWDDDALISRVHNFNNLSFNLGAAYEFNKYFTSSINGGYAWRPPSIAELYADGLHHGAAAIETGDRTLSQERGWNANIDLHFRKKNLDVEAVLFYYHFDNYIYLQPQNQPALTVRGAFPTFQYVETKANFYGADVFAKYQFGKHFYVKHKTSLVYAYDVTNDGYLANIPAPQFENSFGYQLSKEGKLSKSTLAISMLNVMEQRRYEQGSDFAPPPQGYTLLNFQAHFELEVFGMDIILGAGVNNLLNTTYRDYLNRFRYYADEMGRNYSVTLTVPF